MRMRSDMSANRDRTDARPSAWRAPGTITAIVLLLCIGAAGVAAPWIAPHDPAAQLDIAALKNAPPSLSHPFGTDSYSRDLLSRSLHGARVSLTIGLLGALVAGLMATLVGLLAAWSRPGVGDTVMGAVDAVRAIPRKILLLALVLLVPQPTILTLALLLGATSWTAMSRVVFVQSRQLRSRDFIVSARATGVPPIRMLVRHVLPHLASTMAAASAILLADLLAVEAGLSFLGLGVRPPTASWGGILQDGIPYLTTAWWTVAVPCTLLVLTVVSVAHVADRMSDSASTSR